MQLEDFPRPQNDNRRGIHWSAGPYHLMGDKLTPWLDELEAMNIKWVKLMAKGDRDLSDKSTRELCRRLVERGIFPIVRLYRERQNPGTLTQGQRELARELVGLGVRYFETNNEPNLPLEWKDQKMPRNWLEIVTQDWIHDADFLISIGALPATPALSFGGGALIVEETQRQGRLDLFEKGAWVAIHNYCLNHPLSYPYDDVNLHGRPLTAAEYDALGPYTTDPAILAALKQVLEPGSYEHVANPHWAWMDGPHLKNSRETINQMRERQKRPDCTLADDADCFREHELAAQTMHDILGYHVPIITTEGGVIVGDKQDGRYPRMSLDRHREYTLAMFDFMMNEASDYYFALCPWIIANYHMGLKEINWESQAWYSDWNCPHRLPTVDAVKAMPAVGGAAPRQGVIEGTVTNGAGRRLQLTGPGGVREQAVAANGQFRFANLAAGTYNVQVVDTNVKRDNLQIDGTNTINVTLTLPPLQLPDWQGVIVQNTSGPTPVGGMGSFILCRVIGKERAPVTIRTSGWSHTAETGTKGPDSCEFAPLWPGEYTLEPQGLGASVKVFLDGVGMAIVEFRQTGQQPPPPPPPPPTKTINHYVLLAKYLPGKEIFLSVGRYMAKFAPTIGFDPEEAKHARYVTILGRASPGEDTTLEMALREAECQVERINDNAANIVDLLNKMVAEGRRFLTM